MAETLLTVFADAVRDHAGRVALVTGDGTEVTFAALSDRVAQLAAAWQRQGMRPGDRILIAMPVGADLYAALAAIWSLGATAVLPEPAMGLKGLRQALVSAQVTGICASGAYVMLRLLPGLWGKPLFRPNGAGAEALPALPAPDPAALALISFTSGSTGQPKAIPRSHAFLMAQYRAVAPLLDSDRDERDLVAFPVFVLINLAQGRSSILPNWSLRRMDRLTPAALMGWIETQGATRLLLPPALCALLAKTGLPPRVRTLFTGGGPIFPDLVAQLHAAAPDLRIIAVYGSTEAEPIAEVAVHDLAAGDIAAMAAGQGLLVGPPVPALHLRIRADEVQVSGPHVNAGYLDPAHDAENKIREGAVIWHRTGDAGRLDAQGRLWLLGRLGGAVETRLGRRYPFQIETAARLWPGVVAAALVAVRGRAVLAITGDPSRLADWQARAGDCGIDEIRHLAALPMDRRHRSKVDAAALRRQLGG